MKVQMTEADRRFLERLSRGPAGLLLGQAHLAMNASTDPLLTVTRRKLEIKEAIGPPYDVLLTSLTSNDPSFFEWLDEKSRSLAVSTQLEEIAQYRWISVWSSAIDTLWADAFERSDREIQKIFSDEFHTPDPRNRRRLHCTFLFGSITRTEINERPPVTRLEYIRRRAVAQALARRIPTVIGPTGTLAIEAYRLGDWFAPDDLLGVVTQMLPGQCHIFNAPDGLLSQQEVHDLIESGLLISHARSLASILAEGSSAGIVELGASTIEGDLQRLLSFANITRSVPRDLWTSLSASGHLLDESVLADPRPLSADATYAEFRRFIGAFEGRPDWQGIARGFTFARDIDKALDLRVAEYAGQRELHERPIVLHGATGTGKTAALASLAYRLARQRTYPVTFVDRRTERFDRAAVDRFCQWAEDCGAAATVVIWDGMRGIDNYEQAARYFASRGRRVILLGSTYRIPDNLTANATNYILAPSELTPGEIPRLENFLGRFDERLRALARISGASEPSFLAFLYRLLPPTRAAMRRGVVRELERVERIIVERSITSDVHYEPSTTLGRALFEAGLIPDLRMDRSDDLDMAGEQFSAIEDLTALVMVPAQFGHAVPLELVLRASGSDGFVGIPKLLQDVDLVRWVEDSEGNFLLTARSSLEAQIIARSRLGTASSEARYAHRLLVEVRDRDMAISGASEVDFAVNLVRSLARRGANADRYYVEFPTLAAALNDLRNERGVANPRLMLQEAHLLREWSMRLPTDQRAAKLQALAEASSILNTALELVPPGRQSRIRGTLHVELASTYGVQASTLGTEADVQHDRELLFNSARQAVIVARVEDQETYYPVDVLAWTTLDMLRDGNLDNQQKAELIAEVLAAFELIDSLELDSDELVEYQKRRQQFGDAVGDIGVADDAFETLARQGSGAGVYLRARQIAGRSAVQDALSVDSPRLRRALDYLEAHRDLVAHDIRCLNLKFDLWWLLNAKQRPFADERYGLPFNGQKWREVLAMILDMESSGNTYREVPLLYIRGLCEFHLGDYAGAFDTFREVTRRSDEVHGRRRIVRSYLASSMNGRPQTYTGTIRWVSEDQRRGEVFVERIRRTVAFIPREFAGRRLEPAANLGDFHIAFNFLGVIADPPGYLHSRRDFR